MDNWFVVLMGLGTVFVGLICIVIITKIMSFFCNRITEKKPVASVENKTVATPAPAAAPAQIPNKQEFVAAVSAAIAEEMGSSIEGIRILSIKQI